MTRVDGWQQAFWNAITAARDRPFEWGAHDCVLFAASMVDTICGTNFYDQARTQYPYSSEDEARAILIANGGITGLVTPFLGDPINWGALGHGDVVLISPIALVTDMEALCVHDGQKLICPGKGGGLTSAPMRCALYGWKVG